MRQKLLTIVAALSLMLSAATAILWIRSYWRADVISFRSSRVDGARMDTRRFDALSSRARFVVIDTKQQILPEADPSRTFVDRSPQPQGWSYGAGPAGSPVQPAKPQFNALGLCVELWERETPIKYYFPGIQNPNGKVRTSGMFLAIPHWMLVLIGLALPTWWWFLRRRRLLRLHRLNHGLCLSCGYDLRASPQGGRCPECGAVAAKPPQNPPMQRTATASSGAAG